MRAAGRRDVALLAILAAVVAAGCESRREAERRAAEAEAQGRRSGIVAGLPDALMIRFVETRGSGLTREGWELEVLQLGADARLRGSLRSAARVVPVAGTLTPGEWRELWTQVSVLPLDRFRVEEDSTAAAEGWTKRLDVDIVAGERRILSRNSWRRPPLDAPWLAELEGMLRVLATEHALRPDGSSADPDSTREAVQRAIQDAMRDLGASP